MDDRQIRLMYEQDREAALRALDMAGIAYRDSVEKGFEAAQSGLANLVRHYKVSLESLGQDAVDTFHQMAMGTAQELGARGGIGAMGEEIARSIGEWSGKGIAMGLTKALGVEGPWVGIAGTAGSIIGSQLARSFERYESLRILGAKRAAAMTGGVPTGQENYFEMGRQYTLQSLEIRGVTGASAQAVDELVQQLSRVGIKFNEAGKEAIKYAQSSDTLLNLEKGLTAELETSAVQRYGEAWSDVTEVIQDTTAVTQYWQSVAERTGSAQATALASNQNLLNMYKQVMDATKNTSMSMTGLSGIMAGAVNTFGKIGMRPEMIGSLTAEFVSKIAPRSMGMEETIKQGFFLRETLNTTEAGRRVNAIAADITQSEQLDPLLSNVGLSIFMARDKGGTEQFASAFLESVAAAKDQMPGTTPTEKNTLMVLKTNAMTGMSIQAATLMMTLAQEYKDKVHEGMTPSQALREAGKNDAVQALAGQLGMRGISGEEMIKRMAPLGQAAMSTEQKLGLATERMMMIHEPDAFWGNMSKSIMEGLKRVNPGGAPAAPPGLAAFSGVGAAQPEASAVPDSPSGAEQTRTTAANRNRDSVLDYIGAAASQPARKHQVASYSTSPGHGVRQVNISVDDSYFSSDVNAIAEGIASIESRGKGDPYSKMGPATSRGDRAYGKYQIMGANIPKWTEEAGLGRMTPQQFLASPEAQEKTAKHKMQEYYNRFGNVGDVASMWHSGIPLAQAVSQQRKDVLGTFTGAYARRVNEYVAASRLRG